MNIIKIYHRICFWIKDVKMNIRFAYQRVFRGYDDTARWNLNDHIAKQISEITFWMAENGSGYPIDLTQKKWENILKQISFGFSSWIEMGWYVKDDVEYRRLEKEYRKALKLLAKYHEYLWD